MRLSSRDRWGRPIDLALILDGGQTFTWWRADGRPGSGMAGAAGAVAFEGTAGPHRVRLQLDPTLPPGQLVAEPGEAPAAVKAVKRLLDLRRDYEALDAKLVRRDPLLLPAVAATRGLRLARLDPWEALVSFVLATHTHITRIKAMIRRLVAHLSPDGRSMPAPEALAKAGEEGLRGLGLGYRARYLYQIGLQMRSRPRLLWGWACLDTPRLKERLQDLPGVGPKVADCVLLFGYGRWDVFPIDRWAKRALEATYFGGRPMAIAKLHAFALDRFGPLCALAQAHLFAAARMKAIGVRECPGSGEPQQHRPGRAGCGGSWHAGEVLPG